MYLRGKIVYFQLSSKNLFLGTKIFAWKRSSFLYQMINISKGYPLGWEALLQGWQWTDGLFCLIAGFNYQRNLDLIPGNLILIDNIIFSLFYFSFFFTKYQEEGYNLIGHHKIISLIYLMIFIKIQKQLFENTHKLKLR